MSILSTHKIYLPVDSIELLVNDDLWILSSKGLGKFNGTSFEIAFEYTGVSSAQIENEKILLARGEELIRINTEENSEKVFLNFCDAIEHLV